MNPGDKFPSDPGPPGTLFNPKTNEVLYPTDDPCVYIDQYGAEHQAISPDPSKPHNLDPESTPLEAFPRWPVEFSYRDKSGRIVVGRKNFPEIAGVPSVPINALAIPAWVEMARVWIDRAEIAGMTKGGPFNPWIRRLKRDIAHYGDVSKYPCVVDCRKELGRIWLVANAAQYLARAWGYEGAPPVVNAKGVADHLGDALDTAADWAKNIAIIGAVGLGLYVAWRLVR